MKKLTIIAAASSILLGLLVADQALASPNDTAPACPALTGMSIIGIQNMNWWGGWTWTVLFNIPVPLVNWLGGGGMLGTTASDADWAQKIAQIAFVNEKPSGYATKSIFPNGQWFWECTSDNGNYIPLPGVKGVSLYSPVHNPDGSLAAVQPSLSEKSQLVRTSK